MLVFRPRLFAYIYIYARARVCVRVLGDICACVCLQVCLWGQGVVRTTYKYVCAYVRVCVCYALLSTCQIPRTNIQHIGLPR